MTKEAQEVFEAIERAESIVFFGHENPDGDCVGSAMGMREAIKDLFPGKKAYAVGTHPCFLPSFVAPSDEVDEAIVSSSLAVMVDLSDLDRVEDQRIRFAQKIVCVDHHVAANIPHFPVYRVEDAPSATFVLARALLERYGRIPPRSAPYFFLGLVTDSGRFQFDSEPQTLEIAKTLVECGVDYKGMYRELYRQRISSLRYRSVVYAKIHFRGKVSYAKIRKEDYEPLGLSENEAGSQVNLLSQIEGHPIWILFCERADGSIRTELRSDGTYDVQKVALAFGGGGHHPASGCRLASWDEAMKVVDCADAISPIHG